MIVDPVLREISYIDMFLPQCCEKLFGRTALMCGKDKVGFGILERKSKLPELCLCPLSCCNDLMATSSKYALSSIDATPAAIVVRSMV